MTAAALRVVSRGRSWRRGGQPALCVSPARGKLTSRRPRRRASASLVSAAEDTRGEKARDRVARWCRRRAQHSQPQRRHPAALVEVHALTRWLRQRRGVRRRRTQPLTHHASAAAFAVLKRPRVLPSLPTSVSERVRRAFCFCKAEELRCRGVEWRRRKRSSARKHHRGGKLIRQLFVF